MISDLQSRSAGTLLKTDQNITFYSWKIGAAIFLPPLLAQTPSGKSTRFINQKAKWLGDYLTHFTESENIYVNCAQTVLNLTSFILNNQV